MQNQEDLREALIRRIEAENPLNNRYADLVRIDKDAGKGNFSLIFRADDLTTSQEVCLKFFNPLRMTDTYRVLSFRRESKLLERFAGHPDIIELIEPYSEVVISSDSNAQALPISLMYFATPLAYEDLETHIYSEDDSPKQLLEMFRACCRSVQRLHDSFVAHRDLKPSNFLIFRNGQIRLADFGTARAMSPNDDPLLDSYAGIPFRGDRRYTAPELLIGAENHGNAFYLGDMYSLGAILFETFTQKVLGLDILDRNLLNRLMKNSSGVPEEDLEQWAIDVIPEFATHQTLPEIQPSTSRLPELIAPRISRLYRGMAALDYRKRVDNFEDIFRELNRADVTIDRDAQIRQLIAQRRLWNAGHTS